MTDIVRYDEIFKTPVGYIGIRRRGMTLKGLNFLGDHQPRAGNDYSPFEVNEIGQALASYFKRPGTANPPATELEGTSFQLKVWNALASIPPGETRTYGDLARELNTSPRAVGNACRANPIPIFIPCHRVVSRSGTGGFMGKTGGNEIRIKEWLLAHETQYQESGSI